MRSRPTASDHEAAVARRLELLTDELAGVRGDGSPVTRPRLVPIGADDEVEHDAWVPRGYTRIRPVVPRALPDESVPPGPEPRTVLTPGRHASRRLTGGVTDSLAGALPDTLRGRVLLGAGQLAVVAVVAAVGLALTCWWLVRGGSHQVPAPVALTSPRAALATPVGGGELPSGAALSGSTAPRTRVVVDVTGKVRRPGIAVLRSGARVIDAIRAAGGARAGVDLTTLNLARVVSDGEQIVVGGGPVAVATSAPSGSPVSGLVDINTADETTLETLPEVGPVTAQSIITWRTQHGGFSSVDQLLEVDGIGDATLAKLTPYVTI
ncbi:ComEA family DNA-binding protein [Nocardioides cynanchi]|uniref:ComEA family DNA-binding protein n=1 Tax=Nocardioides cynanchi TaxID=2558918 RepID=UPI00192DC0EB|nr:ComEA family DNA-binding protein [Nocardioides cynanchi]